MKANELIKAGRNRLGMSETEAAEKIGLTIYEYGDIEQHEDEIFTVAHLSQVKRLCNILGIGIFELLNMECAFCANDETFTEEYNLSRHDLIQRRRVDLGLTQDDLGNQIGFETVAIKDMETNPGFLENWSFELVRNLGSILNIPTQILMLERCKKCGR